MVRQQRVNWTLGLEDEYRRGSPLPAASPHTSTLSRRKPPLPTRAASTYQRPLFNTERLLSLKTDGQKARGNTTVLYRRDGFIPYLLDVYIFSIYIYIKKKKKKVLFVDECSVCLLLEGNKESWLGGSQPTCYTQSPWGVSLVILGWLL